MFWLHFSGLARATFILLPRVIWEKFALGSLWVAIGLVFFAQTWQTCLCGTYTSGKYEATLICTQFLIFISMFLFFLGDLTCISYMKFTSETRTIQFLLDTFDHKSHIYWLLNRTWESELNHYMSQRGIVSKFQNALQWFEIFRDWYTEVHHQNIQLFIHLHIDLLDRRCKIGPVNSFFFVAISLWIGKSICKLD